MNVSRILAATSCCAALLTGSALAGETVSVPATATTPAVPAYVARPTASAPAPGVLVLHGCEGYTPHYGEIADWLASHGYVGVAIDSLSPQGIRDACGDFAQSRTQADDARAALDWMRAQPYVDGKRLGILGYSMGGIAVLDVMDSRRITVPPAGLLAAVAYYPACRERAPGSVLVPLRILDGDADDWTPAPPCQELAQAATAAGKTVVITTYPGATHAFNVEGRDRMAHGHHLHYDAKARADSEAQTLDFFQKYLGPSP